MAADRHAKNQKPLFIRLDSEFHYRLTLRAHEIGVPLNVMLRGVLYDFMRDWRSQAHVESV